MRRSQGTRHKRVEIHTVRCAVDGNEEGTSFKYYRDVSEEEDEKMSGGFHGKVTTSYQR